MKNLLLSVACVFMNFGALAQASNTEVFGRVIEYRDFRIQLGNQKLTGAKPMIVHFAKDGRTLRMSPPVVQFLTGSIKVEKVDLYTVYTRELPTGVWWESIGLMDGSTPKLAYFHSGSKKGRQQWQLGQECYNPSNYRGELASETIPDLMEWLKETLERGLLNPIRYPDSILCTSPQTDSRK